MPAVFVQPPDSTSQRETVRLPQLFVRFLAQEPEVNPNLDLVHLPGVKSVSEFCNLDARTTKVITRGQASYLFAVIAPDAPLSKFRTICDWGNWIFPFDDQFDNGKLRDQPEQAAKTVNCLMSAMNGTAWPSEKPAFIRWHDQIWKRIAEEANEGTRKRYARSMADYSDGAVQQVRRVAKEHFASIEEMIATRRQSVGARPLFALLEYAYGLDIPEDVLQHPVIQELEVLCIDFLILVGDILSYRKEENEGVPHNVVASCRLEGMSAQAAFDHIGAMLEDRYNWWEQAVAMVPRWGRSFDADVEKYVEGLTNIIKANLYWSFKSGRYFGDKGDVVKRTGEIDVMTLPPYLRMDNQQQTLMPTEVSLSAKRDVEIHVTEIEV